MMKKILIGALFIIGIASCSSGGFEGYKTKSVSSLLYPTISEILETWVFVNRNSNKYYRVIKYRNYWELSHLGYSRNQNTKITPGYHLGDEKGFGGFDWDHTFQTLEEAKEAAESRGDAFLFNLGREYQYHDGSLYDNSSQEKLKRIDL